MVGWIILVITVYLIIGGIVNAIVTLITSDDGHEFDCLVLFWPIFIGMVIIFGSVYGAMKLGQLIVNGIKQLIHYIV